jgi:hypothetical protein
MKSVCPTGCKRDLDGIEATTSRSPCKVRFNQRLQTRGVHQPRLYQYQTICDVEDTGPNKLMQSNFVGQSLRLKLCLDEQKARTSDRFENTGRRLRVEIHERSRERETCARHCVWILQSHALCCAYILSETRVKRTEIARKGTRG